VSLEEAAHKNMTRTVARSQWFTMTANATSGLCSTVYACQRLTCAVSHTLNYSKLTQATVYSGTIDEYHNHCNDKTINVYFFTDINRQCLDVHESQLGHVQCAYDRHLSAFVTALPNRCTPLHRQFRSGT